MPQILHFVTNLKLVFVLYKCETATSCLEWTNKRMRDARKIIFKNFICSYLVMKDVARQEAATEGQHASPLLFLLFIILSESLNLYL